MPEEFQIKAMGTIGAVQNVQEEIKKKKSKVINHMLLWHEYHPSKHRVCGTGQAATYCKDRAGREHRAMISTGKTNCEHIARQNKKS